MTPPLGFQAYLAAANEPPFRAILLLDSPQAHMPGHIRKSSPHRSENWISSGLPNSEASHR